MEDHWKETAEEGMDLVVKDCPLNIKGELKEVPTLLRNASQ